MTACGPLGDDEDPTTTPPPASGLDSTVTVIGSPAATPMATPRSAGAVGTPRAGAASTRVPDNENQPAQTAVPDDEPVPSVASDETPLVDGDDVEPSGDTPEPTTVVVADCDEPDPLPDRTGRQNRLVAEEGLRLRAGPGTSCDEILSLSLDTQVRVVSGVVQAEDDENDWVKVEIDGEEGWVAVEFLVNPPDA